MASRETAGGNLSDYVRQYLINYIQTNQLRSGAPAPSEVRVSAELGISRGIVREAFRALAMAGILEISNGRSPRVGRISDEGIAQVLQHAISTEQASIQQVLDLRAAIEIHAAELAAKHRTPQAIDGMLAEVAIMDASKEVPNRFTEADARFHEILAKATANPLYGIITGAIRNSLKDSIRAGLRNRTSVRQLDQVVATHRKIAEAIRDEDPVRAREWMTTHFHEALLSFEGKNVNGAIAAMNGKAPKAARTR